MPVAEITAGITSIRAAHDLTKAYQSDLSSQGKPSKWSSASSNGAFAETGIGEADLKTTIIDLINGGWCVPCAHERRGGTSSAAVAAMNSRRFIRSSSQLEETSAEYQVSMVVALSTCANTASQMRRVAQDGYGSIAPIRPSARDFRSTPDQRTSTELRGWSGSCRQC
jgi:hypothetical protein